MPTRGASRGGLSGQLSMNDELVNQLMGSAAGPTKSFSVEQFAEMFKPLAAGGAGGARRPPRRMVVAARRARRGSANPTTSSGSGKTSEEIWKISSSRARTACRARLRSCRRRRARARSGRSASSPLPTGSMLFPQKSIEKLVGEHAGERRRPATEWMDLMLAIAPPGPGLQPTSSARLALEKAAERLVTEMDASPTALGARSAARGARGASLLGRTAPVRKDAPPPPPPPVQSGAAGQERGRAASEAADAERVPFTLPPKKKGRKKKGEVDTETEEEKAMRAERGSARTGRAPPLAPTESRAEGRARKKEPPPPRPRRSGWRRRWPS